MKKDVLLGKTLAELQDICLENGFPKFTATQIAGWIYKQRVDDIEKNAQYFKESASFFL